MYYMTFKGNCKKYTYFNTLIDYHHSSVVSSEKSNLRLPGNRTSFHNQTFQCKSGTQIKLMFLNDLKFDCGPNGEDEPILMNLLKTETYLTCKDPKMLPCLEGHSKCYFIHDICIYKLNINAHLIPCQNGGHLHDCIRFECNLMYKCRGSYCIPWLYACDGKWDCPNGDDEDQILCTGIEFCKYMYKCQKMTQRCLHFHNICDGKNDCPLGDDEQHCNLQHVYCPLECFCLLMAINCYDVSIQTIYSELQSLFLYISISHATIISMEKINKQIENAVVVKLIETSIKEICQLLPAANLLLLDVSFNFLIKLKKNCFAPIWHIQIISLNDNLITYLEAGSFYNIPYLEFLNISNNPLLNLPQSIFKHSFHLKLFYIVNVPLKDIDFQALNDLPIKLIITNDYHLCCISSNVSLCPTYKPWYFSCDDILPKISMNVLFNREGREETKSYLAAINVW